MRIAIIGATGNVGRRLVDEALSREHEVTAIARNPSKLAEGAHLRLAAGDAQNPQDLATILIGHDAAISSIGFRMVGPAPLIDAVRRSGVKRYLVVGGAGSLEASPGRLVMDSPDFPSFYEEEAALGKAFLDGLREVRDLDWTMLSPSALFTAGERTGTFRLGADTLLTGAGAKSAISYEDYAIAMLDEIEKPRNVRRRFTVGY